MGKLLTAFLQSFLKKTFSLFIRVLSNKGLAMERPRPQLIVALLATQVLLQNKILLLQVDFRKKNHYHHNFPNYLIYPFDTASS